MLRNLQGTRDASEFYGDARSALHTDTLTSASSGMSDAKRPSTALPSAPHALQPPQQPLLGYLERLRFPSAPQAASACEESGCSAREADGDAAGAPSTAGNFPLLQLGDGRAMQVHEAPVCEAADDRRWRVSAARAPGPVAEGRRHASPDPLALLRRRLAALQSACSNSAALGAVAKK